MKFGFEIEWEIFEASHPVFLSKFKSLADIITQIFIRESISEGPADMVVFYLGRLCVEDFMEILLLCGNGYGIGALKLLRGLYERIVTAAYIAEQPIEAQRFLNYYRIEQRRNYNHAKDIPGIQQHLSPEQIQEIETTYQGVKSHFEEILCKQCGSKRMMFSWSPLDLKSMAIKVGLADSYWQCYYLPTLQAHSTVSSLITRLKQKTDGGISFEEGAQREIASQALINAHKLILNMLEIQDHYFKLKLVEQINGCKKDFLEVWSKEKKDLSS